MERIPYPMSELHFYRYGNVVVDERNQDGYGERYGHIVGFSRNVNGELLLRVRWEGEVNDNESVIHPGNIKVIE